MQPPFSNVLAKRFSMSIVLVMTWQSAVSVVISVHEVEGGLTKMEVIVHRVPHEHDAADGVNNGCLSSAFND